MQPMVCWTVEGHRLIGDGDDVELVNRFLAHLGTRNFSPATRRAYAYDLLNFLRFLGGRGLVLPAVVPTDLFDYLDWQGQPRRAAPGATVVRLTAEHPDHYTIGLDGIYLEYLQRLLGKRAKEGNSEYGRLPGVVTVCQARSRRYGHAYQVGTCVSPGGFG